MLNCGGKCSNSTVVSIMVNVLDWQLTLAKEVHHWPGVPTHMQLGTSLLDLSMIELLHQVLVVSQIDLCTENLGHCG